VDTTKGGTREQRPKEQSFTLKASECAYLGNGKDYNKKGFDSFLPVVAFSKRKFVAPFLHLVFPVGLLYVYVYFTLVRTGLFVPLSPVCFMMGDKVCGRFSARCCDVAMLG
jgi:hypothetical protein